MSANTESKRELLDILDILDLYKLKGDFVLYLTEGIVCCAVLRSKVEKQLLDVPVKQIGKVGLKVESYETQIAFFTSCTIVRNAFTETQMKERN